MFCNYANPVLNKDKLFRSPWTTSCNIKHYFTSKLVGYCKLIYLRQLAGESHCPTTYFTLHYLRFVILTQPSFSFRIVLYHNLLSHDTEFHRMKYTSLFIMECYMPVYTTVYLQTQSKMHLIVIIKLHIKIMTKIQAARYYHKTINTKLRF